MKQIDIKKPKYIIPILILPFILGIGWLVKDMMYLGFLISICFIRYLFNLLYKFFIRIVSSGVNFPFFLSSLISFCILITSNKS